MVRFAPGRLGNLLALALNARMHQQGVVTEALSGVAGRGPQFDMMDYARPPALSLKPGEVEKPTASSTPFARFLEDARNERPELNEAELARWATRDWERMSPKERALYASGAKHRRPQNYKPRRPLPARQQFMVAYIRKSLRANPSRLADEAGAEAAMKWASMSDEERAPYEKRAKDLRDAFEAAVGEYEKAGKSAADGPERRAERRLPRSVERWSMALAAAESRLAVSLPEGNA